MKKFKLLDRYIIKQLFEVFLLGIIIFTSILFASDTFLSLVKQVSQYGISPQVAFLIVILKMPNIIIFAIPMAVLLASIMTFSKLSSNFEITIMRACGISIFRLALPVIIFGLASALTCFLMNEFIAPIANKQAVNLTAWALSQNKVPDGRTNFSFKELDNNKQLKRLFYISSSNGGRLHGITVLDISKKGSTQIVQSKNADISNDSWVFDNGAMYTISNSGKILNTTLFNKLKLFTSFNLSDKSFRINDKDYSFRELSKLIAHEKNNKNIAAFIIKFQEKITIPITSILVALIGIPLAITPPRARFNRGFLFSILIIFCYYMIRAFSVSLGEAQVINPVLSAWIPNIAIFIVGIFLFYRKI